MPGKYDRFKRVGSNLYREPGTGLYYARKKIAQKNHWESLGTTDRLEACKQRDHWIRKLQEAGGMRPKNWRVITLREMCEKARNNLGGKKASIRENVSGLLSTILRHWPEGGEVQFSRIKVSHCREFFNRVRKIDGSRISTSYFISLLATAKQLFADAKIAEYRIDDPMAAANIQIPPPDKIVRVTPSMEEFHAILDYVRSNMFNPRAEHSADMLEFAGLFGIGNAEIENLSWGQIDYTNKKLDLIRIKTGRPFKVPIYDWGAPLLNKLLAKAAAPGGLGTAPETKVFSTAMPVNSLSAACQKLALPNFTPRSLRRLFIYNCRWSKVPDEFIASSQGHSDGGKLIGRIYDDASSSSDVDRHAEELEQQRTELNKASKIFGKTTEELKVPIGNTQIAKASSELSLEIRLAQAKADLQAKSERVTAKLKKSGAAYFADLAFSQPELSSLNGDTGLISASVMRKAQAAKFDKVIEALIAGGNLQQRAKSAQADYNQADRKCAAIKLYSKNAADEAQQDFLGRQEKDAMRERAEGEKHWNNLKEALKRCQSRSMKTSDSVP